MKTAIVTFFDSYPPKTGSGRVCTDFFLSWPTSKKKLFQLSTTKIHNKKIETIMIKYNKPFFKILKIFKLIKSVRNFFYKEKKKILIIEGPSWILYSFLVVIYFKLIQKNVIIIYRSHSVEHEIRKKNSNFIISFFTRIFESYVINNCALSTSVSQIEKKKFKKLYNKNTYLFPNSINIKKLETLKIKKIKKKIPKNFILFCGSYDYPPNRIAINYIIKNLLPDLKLENVFLILTGNHKINFDIPNVINLKFISIAQLKYLHSKSICLIVPIFEGYGTRIKILEALVWNNQIISTKKGIEGIKYNGNKNIIIANDKIKMINGIKFLLKNKKKKVFYKESLKNISMESNCKIFYNYLNKNF